MIVLVFAGGAAGAVLRYLADTGFRRAGADRFPYGIVVANCVASFLLAIVSVGVVLHEISTGTETFVGMGLCGALSTYSTLSNDTIGLVRKRQPAKAIANIVGTTIAGIACAALGAAFAFALWF
ncbi:MAG TPA: CrcB family protein [Candidatus Stackebrandtia faecavium]|nr:CrcB family protein [Candidatus Stackebrandtia faecavium]